MCHKRSLTHRHSPDKQTYTARDALMGGGLKMELISGLESVCPLESEGGRAQRDCPARYAASCIASSLCSSSEAEAV